MFFPARLVAFPLRFSGLYSNPDLLMNMMDAWLIGLVLLGKSSPETIKIFPLNNMGLKIMGFSGFDFPNRTNPLIGAEICFINCLTLLKEFLSIGHSGFLNLHIRNSENRWVIPDWVSPEIMATPYFNLFYPFFVRCPKKIEKRIPTCWWWKFYRFYLFSDDYVDEDWLIFAGGKKSHSWMILW